MKRFFKAAWQVLNFSRADYLIDYLFVAELWLAILLMVFVFIKSLPIQILY